MPKYPLTLNITIDKDKTGRQIYENEYKYEYK